MKLFNKTAIALTLSLIGAASSVSALAMVTDQNQLQEVEVEVVRDVNKDVNVFVSVDGKVTTVDVSPSVMKNREELEKLLADVPEDIREKLIENLSNKNLHDGNFNVIVDGDVTNELNWVVDGDIDGEHHVEIHTDGIDQKVMVMEFSDDVSGDGVAHKVIKKMRHPSMHKNIQFVHKGTMSADSIVRMVKHSELTADDLDTIQQALDAKR